MKKQNLSMPKKIISASLAVLIASSSMAFMPAVAHADTMSAKDVVVSELKKDAYGSFNVEVKYNEAGNYIFGYNLYGGERVDSELVRRLGYYCADVDVSSTPYVVDVSDLNIRLAPDAAVQVCGCGTQAVQVGYVGDGFVYNGRGRLKADGEETVVVGGQYVSSTVSRIEFGKDYVQVFLKRTTTDAYKEVEKLIDDIGEVTGTPECKARIEAAEEGYNWLPTNEKYLVGNYITLWEAQIAYRALVR